MTGLLVATLAAGPLAPTSAEAEARQADAVVRLLDPSGVPAIGVAR
ncbi:hypothetical protein AAII07_03725 [Microvirga sp. 0TCS3.31]